MFGDRLLFGGSQTGLFLLSSTRTAPSGTRTIASISPGTFCGSKKRVLVLELGREILGLPLVEAEAGGCSSEVFGCASANDVWFAPRCQIQPH